MAFPTQNNQVTNSLKVASGALASFAEIVMLAHYAKISKALVLDPSTGEIVSSNVTDETFEGTNLDLVGLSFTLNGVTYSGAEAWKKAFQVLILLPTFVPDEVAAYLADAIKAYR